MPRKRPERIHIKLLIEVASGEGSGMPNWRSKGNLNPTFNAFNYFKKGKYSRIFKKA